MSRFTFHAATDERVELLRLIPGLGGYRRRELERLAPFIEVCRVNAGDTIAVEGTPSREMFFVAEGEASVTSAGRVIATIGPGDFVGEMGVLEHRFRCATVVASTDMVVLASGPRSTSAVLAEPGVMAAVARVLSARLRAANGPAASPRRAR